MSASPQARLVLYRDEHLAVADKPSGLLVHRGWANDRDVLMMRVRDEIGSYVYPIHRLDRGASGVVVFALDKETARDLGKQFEEGSVAKHYLALVRGVPEPEGTIEHAIPRKPKGPRVHARTDYRRLEVFGRYSLVEARPRTGRLHQIRRHFKHISCPLIGDVNYGKGEHNRLFRERFGLHRLALHARTIELVHPRTGERLEVESELPEDLAAPLRVLRSQRPQAPD